VPGHFHVPVLSPWLSVTVPAAAAPAVRPRRTVSRGQSREGWIAGKFDATVEAHLLHIWHEVHINPQVAQAVKDEVAAWELYFSQLKLRGSKHAIDAHHQDELTFAHSQLHVI
jgi:hypothetical protein